MGLLRVSHWEVERPIVDGSQPTKQGHPDRLQDETPSEFDSHRRKRRATKRYSGETRIHGPQDSTPHAQSPSSPRREQQARRETAVLGGEALVSIYIHLSQKPHLLIFDQR